MNTVTLADILQTDHAVKRAIQIFKTCKPGTFARTVCEELIKPNIEAINKKVGQENDPLYLAYAVEYAIGQAANSPDQGAFSVN